MKKQPRRNLDRVRHSLTYVRAPKPKKPKFELKDGDRVVFLGNTLIERAQKYGYWETMLTARYPNRKIIFRNLGWDGDTVWAESRGIFETPAKGYADMLKHVGRIKPTVLFLGYGNNEAFAGKKGLPRFVKQYNKLLDDLTKVSAKGVRFVLLSPIPTLVPDGRNWVIPPNHTRNLKLYREAIKSIAEKKRAHFVFLYSKLMADISFCNDNGLKAQDLEFLGYEKTGVQLSDSGYFWAAGRIISGPPYEQVRQLEPILQLTAKGGVKADKEINVNGVERTSTGIRWNQTSTHNIEGPWVVKVAGLKRGDYELRVDGQRIDLIYNRAVRQKFKTKKGNPHASAESWAKGIILSRPSRLRLLHNEKLRQAIIAKNRLYFHSWRPQNITYLFLFRKHEQGQNAKDVKEFLKLVAAKEKEIDRLKKPVTRTYELIRVKAKK